MKDSRMMFSFVDKIRPNPLGGRCYSCNYCYIHGEKGMKRRFKHIYEKYSGEFKLYDHIFGKNLKNVKKPMFFCDCIDWLHEDITNNIKARMIKWFRNNPNVNFLSLTKNPKGYNHIMPLIPDNLILGCTIESNIDYPNISNAPLQSERIKEMLHLNNYMEHWNKRNKIFISIEPIMSFDFDKFLNIIDRINPTFGVAIGYDNYKNKLQEPSLKKTLGFITKLKSYGITVFTKTLRFANWEDK